jgi:MFS family permease
MKKRFKLSEYWVHLIAILIFTTLSLVYFFPVLEGKKLDANDTNVFRASAKEIIEHREKYHEEPLWTNSMFGGMPAFMISTIYPGNLFKPVYNLLKFPGTPIAPIILLMLGFYIILIVYRVNPWIAIAGAIAFAFCSYNFILLAAGHNTKVYALAYIAPMIAGIILAIRKNRLAGAALAGIFLAFELIANHLQITYYALLIVIIYGISELVYAIKEKKITGYIKSLGVLVVAVILAAGTNFTHLSTTQEYSKYTTRGGSNLSSDENTSGLDKDYITGWSIGIDETLTLLIPNFMGGGSSIEFDKETETYKTLQSYNAIQLLPVFSPYRGEQPSTSSVYAGAIVIFLFVLGLFLVEGREKWWLLAATIISILLSWGKNFMPFTNLFLDYFPGYNKFRAVSTILIIAGFTIPLMATLTLRNIFQDSVGKKKFNIALLWSFGITGGICLLFTVFPGLAGSLISSNDYSLFQNLRLTPDVQNIFVSALTDDRRAMLRSDSFRSLLFIVLAAITLLAFYYRKIEMKYAVGLIILLILLDMWPVNKRYLNESNFRKATATSEAYPMTVADEAILEDQSLNYRVLNLTVSPFNDASTSNWHKSIGGYHGAKLQIYNELIHHCLATEINSFIAAYQKSNYPASVTTEVAENLAGANSLNMLNTKYIIVDQQRLPLENKSALGNAWFVDSYIIVENADEEISLISSFDPSGEALINKSFEHLLTKDNYAADSSGRIELISYKANELIYHSRSTNDGLAVFSEIYYPAGWKSYIDGNELPHFKADYVLRAMEVPAGDHEIIFRFEPDSFRTGTKVSIASSILLILLCAGSLYMFFRKNTTTAEADDSSK